MSRTRGRGPSAIQFTIDPPAAPTELLVDGQTGDVVVQNPTFSWQGVARASRYELTVARDVNFASLVALPCTTPHTSFTPYLSTVVFAPLVSAGTCTLSLGAGERYYWRVRAVDAPANTYGIYSE